MPHPIKNLPVAQNWDCHSCGDCCRRMEAVITDEEKRRIEALDLADDPEVAPKPWFRPASGDKWSLAHRPDGGCVFLTGKNYCRIQERFGAEVKPFVCRLFPFLLIPAGNQWRVGMRFSCPSAAANRGRPVAQSEKDLVQLSRLLEKHVGRSADSAPAPPLRPGQQVAWPELLRAVQVLTEIVKDRGDRVERRLRRCLAVARIGAQAKLENLSGNKLSEFLKVVSAGLEPEIPGTAADVAPPDRILGRLLFRVLLAIYARKDRGVSGKPGVGGRIARVRDGWRFARGRGHVPRINESMPEISFEEVELRPGIPPELDETLERYYTVKLSSMQFCGPSNFDLPFWAGVESLILTFPMILWLYRAFGDRPPAEALQCAIQLVDDHFGGDRMLGLPHIRHLQRTIAERGELEKLVAWYGR